MMKKLIQSRSLSVKIMSVVIIMIILLAVMFTLQTRNSMTSVYMDQLEKRGITIANIVAAQSANLIIMHNYYDLHELVKDTQKGNDDVRYVFVISNSGELLAHSFASGFPKGLLQTNQLPKGQNYHTEVLQTEEGIIRDIVTPVLDGRVGYVRVGMTDKNLQSAIQQTTLQLLIDTLVVSVLGIVVASILTSRLTRPLRELADITHAIVAGDLTCRASIESTDEIGRLGNAFNEMTEHLYRSDQVQTQLMTELEKKEELRTQLLQKVIVAQEEERKRISRELHDETGQVLTTLMVGLKAMEENCPQNSTRLQDLRELVGKTLDEIHRMAVELRPSVLDDMGLIPALEKYVSNYRTTFKIDVDLHVDPGERLPREVETLLYRIIQEALTNIAKYAQASNVSVLLQRSNAELMVILEDDGVGFDVEKVLSEPSRKNALGLFGMKERVTLLGGSLVIESSLGLGTTIYVRIPVAKDGGGNGNNQSTNC
jgi:signal transduction histidine kinase